MDALYNFLESGDLDTFFTQYQTFQEAMEATYDGCNVVNSILLANISTAKKIELYQFLLPKLSKEECIKRLNSLVKFQGHPSDKGTYLHAVELFCKFNHGKDIHDILNIIIQKGYTFSFELKLVVMDILEHNHHVSVEERRIIKALIG